MINILNFEDFVNECYCIPDNHSENHPHDVESVPSDKGRNGLHPVMANHTKWKINTPNPKGYAPPHGHIDYVSDLIGRMEDKNGMTTHTSQIIGAEHSHNEINGNNA